MNQLGEQILNHYRKYLGDYIGSDSYSDNAHQIQLMGFHNVIENCLLFATFGMSIYSKQINNCCEVILVTDCDYDKCADTFMNAIFYAVGNRMNLRRGTLIDGIERIDAEFSKKYNKTAFYFTDVYLLPEEFSMVDEKCRIYMAFYISKEEADYIKKYGFEKFEELLEKSNVDVINVKRKTII